MDPDEAAVSGYLITYFDRLLAYRNYYVHGIRMIIADANGEPAGVIEMVSAKGSLKVHRQNVTKAEIAQATQWALKLDEAMLRLVAHFQGDHKRPPAERRWLPTLEELQRMFPWPDILQKPQDYLL